MPIISDKDQQTIREMFDLGLSSDIEIVLFTERPSLIIIPGKEPCATCADTQAILEEVSALSDKIKLTVREISEAREEAFANGIHRVPAFLLRGAAKGSVRFFGIPSGYEFSALIADIIDSSKGETDLSEETRKFLGELEEDINIKVFTTPTCPYCPAAARLAHQMAVESARVTADVIEANEFPDLSRRYAVKGVPKTVINDAVEFVGAQPEELLLEQIKAAISSNGAPS
jgi:glutaredoxin-like protein